MLNRNLKTHLTLSFAILSAIAIFLAVFTTEFIFHFYISKPFINSIKASAIQYNLNISDNMIINYCERLLHYTYLSMFISGLLSEILAIVLGIILSKKLLNPLDKLSLMVTNLKNRVYTEITDQFPGELNNLKERFNELSHRLKEQENLNNDLVINVSHELKTPLTTLQGYLEGMSDGVLSPDITNIDILLLEINRLKKLVEDMEDSTVSYKETLLIKPVNIEAFTFKIKNFYCNICLNKDIELVFKQNNVDMLYADENRLFQAVSNLINNAIKYSPRGSIITISFYYNYPVVCISVKDTGVGIPAGDLPYIFDRFFRGEKSRSRTTGGSGIGLSIVSQIISAHNGTIEVTSTPGSGTEFIIKLPYLMAANMKFINSCKSI